jgi:hypothetical protein
MRGHRFLFLALGLLIAAAATPAAAQQSAQDAQQQTSEQFTQFVISQPYAQTLMQLIAAEEAKHGITDCEDKGSFSRDKLWILDQVAFGSDSGPPTGGKWIDRLTVEHCGKTMTYNFLISAKDDGTPQIATLVPGDSNTDPQLQRETLPLAEETASEHAAALDPTLASCADVWVKHAEFEGELAADSAELTDGATGGWTEIWDVEVCNRTVPLEMTFLLFDSGKRATARAEPVNAAN